MGEILVSGLVEGGKATSGPPFGPALGPLGVNISEIVGEINRQTAAFAGVKIPVKVFVDSATKHYRVEIGSPTTSALILKELGVSSGAKTKDEVIGNLTMEQIKKIASLKESKLYGASLKERVKQVLGTCKSMGVTCEGQNPKEVIKKLDSGELAV
ncbi:MAG: 50S ribosomal protein L11 [Candidatus Micrarchaeaceae archaeon]